MRKLKWLNLTMLVALLLSTSLLEAQMKPDYFSNNGDQILFNAGIFQSLQWRNIGPHRGGRTNAVSGVPGQPMVYYMGTVGGGVWKTEDAGISWNNISDSYFQTASVGAIAVAESDPNILYVGMGEHAVRGVMSSHGDGVYRSTDAGKTWQHLGLARTKQISKILIHPENPDIVWVAAQGPTFGPGRDRGVFKTVDGGRTWEHVLYISTTTGASDITMDIQNPRILYAGMWDHLRKPWEIRSGGKGSGIYKSVDGGNNWIKLSQGLPASSGKIGIDVSPANPNVVYANVEAESGGVFRSDDAGESWIQVSEDRITIGRAWYYTKIVADPFHEQGVYILNAPLLRSVDGGKSYEQVENPHTDQHDLWINPDNPKNMILGNDGGACITFNGGQTWSSQKNQPTAQLYRVIADNRFPYYLYTGQQDNTTLAIPSRTAGSGISDSDWYPVAGGESAFIALDPNNPNKVYGTNYLGNISVYDSKTGLQKDIMAYPTAGLASIPSKQKYRFNWNAPLVMSPFEANTLYHGANILLKTTDGGNTWEEISTDLTRNEKIKQGPGGFPFTNEGAGAEVYNTISYLALSPNNEGEIWVGTDDGLLHLSKDDGENWESITPPQLGNAMINSIELSHHNPGLAYIAASRNKFNDFRPLIFKTNDYGKTWEKITNGIPVNTFARVVREDPKEANILYAGTETGLYISFNKGLQWHSFQLNLPITPITDLLIKDNDLVAATAGRSFWILDDLSAIQQSLGQPDEQNLSIYQPKEQVRFFAEAETEYMENQGANPTNGIAIDYYLPQTYDGLNLTLEILNEAGEIIRSYSNQKDSTFHEYEGGPTAENLLPTHRGFNRFTWDFRRASLPGIIDVFVMGDYRGGLVAPGKYIIRISNEMQTAQTSVTVKADPRIDADWETYQLQEEILLEIEESVRDIHLSVNKMRLLKDQISTLVELLKKSKEHKDLVKTGEEAIEKIINWEHEIIQTQQKTYQDVINYPNKLNAEFLDLKRRIDTYYPDVTQGVQDRYSDLHNQWISHKSEMQEILQREVDEFNRIFKEKNIPALIIPPVNAF